MKKIKYNCLNGIGLIMCTTVGIMIFMILMPIILVNNNIATPQAKEDIKEFVVDTSSEIINNQIVLDKNSTISVYLTLEERIEEINIEDYICGVIANEMPANFDIEALKAQAIASRTYLVSKLIKNCPTANGADICDSTHCQVYRSKESIFSKWGDINAEEYWNKIKEAVDSTNGKVLSYNGELVLYPQFFSTSSGRTENAVDVNWGDVPYLKSVESLGEEIAPKFTSEKEISIQELVSIFNSKYPEIGVTTSNISSSISVLSRSEAGSVIEILVGNKKISGQDFRFLLGLNSANFDYSINGNIITFNCKGYGHGVGMSQWGANVMAKEGSSYEEILKHYYTGINISDLILNN